jgi:hypothetical protein
MAVDFERPVQEEFDRLDALHGRPIDYSDIPETDFSVVKRHRGLPSFLRSKRNLPFASEEREEPVETR